MRTMLLLGLSFALLILPATAEADHHFEDRIEIGLFYEYCEYDVAPPHAQIPLRPQQPYVYCQPQL